MSGSHNLVFLYVLREVTDRDKLAALGAFTGLPVSLPAWRPFDNAVSQGPVLGLVPGAVRELLLAEGTVVEFVLAHWSD